MKAENSSGTAGAAHGNPGQGFLCASNLNRIIVGCLNRSSKRAYNSRPVMEPATAYYINVFVFRCDECGNPIIHWEIYPNSDTLAEAEQARQLKCTNCPAIKQAKLPDAPCSVQFVLVDGKGVNPAAEVIQ